MHHRIWPEGRPDEARSTTSTLKAHAIVAGLQLGMLFPISRARRIRHSRCIGGMPDPHAVEAALEDAGAIAPRDGWPERRPSPAVDGPRGDVHITTHSVI